MALLGFVGVSTIVSLGVAPWLWLVSGACLAVMVLAATCDFRHSGRAAAQ
jgi:hypothetical protein